MRVITTRKLIQGVAQHWRNQYPDSKMDIYEKLAALDAETATANDVNQIIGNGSWTRITCEECKNEVSEVVHFGEDYDTFCVCKECLTKAMTSI